MALYIIRKVRRDLEMEDLGRRQKTYLNLLWDTTSPSKSKFPKERNSPGPTRNLQWKISQCKCHSTLAFTLDCQWETRWEGSYCRGKCGAQCVDIWTEAEGVTFPSSEAAAIWSSIQMDGANVTYQKEVSFWLYMYVYVNTSGVYMHRRDQAAP